MANRVLSIESGRSLIRVLEVASKGREAKVYNSFSFTTPENMFDEHDSSKFGQIIKEELKKRRITTKKAIFVINSGRMAAREVVIPAVKDNRIADLIEANASDYFPVDLSQYVLVHEIIEKFKEEDSNKLRLNVLAIPKDIIEFYEELAKECGLTLEGMSYTGNASKQLMISEGNTGVRALVKVDGRSSLITIMNGDRVELQRHINYGVAEAVSVVCESGIYGKPDFVGGLAVLREKNMIFTEEGSEEGLSYMESTDVETRIKEEITESLRVVAGSIVRILDYYQSRNQEAKLEAVRVIGIGADVAGFMEFLSTEFGIPTSRLPLVKGISVVKNSGEAENYLPTYYSCLGISLKSGNLSAVLNKKSTAVAKRGEGKKAGSGSLVVPAVISSLFILAAGGLFAFYFMAYNAAQDENIALNSQINELSYIDEVIKDNAAAKADNDWANEAMKLTETKNNGLKEIIEKLERKMPSDIRVLSLNAVAETISLNITVDNKESAADIIKHLREFEEVKITNISTISETKSEDGKIEVTFSVDLIYADSKAETEEAGNENVIIDIESEGKGE